MGNTPSQALQRAVRDGDLAAAISAQAAGGSINYQGSEGESKQRCPLQLAARYGHLSLVSWLLSQGALDLPDVDGVTALMSACKHGHANIAATLLDKGDDVFVHNKAGQNATDVAGLSGQKHCVRLLEARSCPFAWRATLHCPGFFSDEWKERWLAVYRARPWDNPSVDRTRVVLYIYEGREAALADKVLLRPCLVHVARGAGDIMEVDIACESVRSGQGSHSPPGSPLRFRLDSVTYEWLNRVLADSFAEGRGAAFDSTGLVLQPQPFLAYKAGYETAAFGGLMPHMPMAGQGGQAFSSSGGGGIGSAPPMGSAPPQQLPIMHTPMHPQVPYQFNPSAPPSSAYTLYPASVPPPPPMPPQVAYAQQQPHRPPTFMLPPNQGSPGSAAPGAAAASSAPPARHHPAYLHEGILAMQRALEEGTLLPPGSPDPPDSYVCSITSVRVGMAWRGRACRALLTPPLPPPIPPPFYLTLTHARTHAHAGAHA